MGTRHVAAPIRDVGAGKGKRRQISTFDIRRGFVMRRMARPLRVEFEDAICHVCSLATLGSGFLGLAHSARATTQLRKEMLNV